MSQKVKDPIRTIRTRADLAKKDMIKYNDAAGADKVFIIEPPIKRAVTGGEAVGPGKYVKITSANYTLDLVGRAYDNSKTYRKGDIVSEGTDIYRANVDILEPEAFEADNWVKVAPKQIAAIPAPSGAVVTTGRYHNTVTTAGFLVDDDSEISFQSVRD